MNSGFRTSLRGLAGAVLVAGLASAQAAPAAAVGPALDRPALQTPRALRAVMQAAARAGERLVAVGERGVVLLSDDHGRHWRQVPCPTSVGLTAVRFVDARHGWIVGHAGVVLATRDGGETWQRQLDGVQLARLLLEAARTAGDPPSIAEAERLVQEGADKPLLDLHFFDDRNGWVVGAYNIALVTGDGGATWRPASARLDNPKALHLYAIRTAGDAMLIAGEQGLVLLSQDRGRSFRRLQTPYRGSFFTAEMNSAEDFLVAGLRGNVWRTRDAGAHWHALTGGAPVNVVASAKNDAGEAVLASQAGVLMTANADTLAVAAERLKMPNGLLWLQGREWLALTVDGPAVVKAEVPGTVR